MLQLENQKHRRFIKYRGVDVYKADKLISILSTIVAHSEESSRMGSEDGSLSR